MFSTLIDSTIAGCKHNFPVALTGYRGSTILKKTSQLKKEKRKLQT